MALFQMEHLWLGQLAEGVVDLYLDVAGRSVNVLSRTVLAELAKAIDYVEEQTSINLLLVRSGKQGNFIAGADVHELSRIQSPEEAIALSLEGQELFNRLARLRTPTVAIISGACLGGGLELALACDYRVVMNHAQTSLGFPEIELGLVPAWGGTLRLPRVIGLQRALQMILGTRRLRPAEALRWGLADHLSTDPIQAVPDFLGKPIKKAGAASPPHNWRTRLLEGTRLGRWLIWRGTRRVLNQRLPEDLPAPWEAFEAIRIGVTQGTDAGLTYEREAAGRLCVSNACRNLVHLFLQRDQARSLPEPDETDEPPIRRVGIVGAGVMGAGIAQLAALHGCEVVVQEQSESALGVGMLRVVGLFEQAVRKGVLSLQEMTKRMANIHGSTTWKGFASLDVVIEAVLEDPQLKRTLFQQLEDRVSPSTILASNTSSLEIGHLQDGMEHPERVAGLHFFNPVHKMPLVEVAFTGATNDHTTTTLRRFAIALGKAPVLVRDSSGFIVNRVLMPYLNEALMLVGEGVRIELVDRTMRRFGMPMGPLEVLDQVGLDVAANIASNVQAKFQERFAPHPGFALMKQKKWLGRKTGLGFYRWQRGKKRLHFAAQSLLAEESFNAGYSQSPVASAEDQMKVARDRMVGLMVNEASLCLEEGLAADSSTIDFAMVLGSGWAPHRGGPLRYAEQTGFSEIVQSLQELAQQYGSRFQPCNKLIQLATP